MSELINEAIREALAEDAEDLAAFRARRGLLNQTNCGRRGETVCSSGAHSMSLSVGQREQ